MIGRSERVRRLCVCVAAPPPGLLEAACRAWGPGRLYVERIEPGTAEIGFASPGADEVVLLQDLIPALYAAADRAPAGRGSGRLPALATFHVGITRVEGDRMGGAAVARARELLSQLAPQAAAALPSRGRLIVGISAALFEDIAAECGFVSGWRPLADGGGRFRVFGAP